MKDFISGIERIQFINEGGGPTFTPQILLSDDTIAENAAVGTAIGELSIINTPPDWGTTTYTVIVDPDNLFAIDGDDVETDGALDFETAESHQVTIRATPSGPHLPVDETFTIFVTDVDEVSPVISVLSPLDNATGVAVTISPAATFSKNIQFGTGNITLKKSSDNSTIEAFDVATEQGTGNGQVSISGAVLTINPTATLLSETGYYIQIDATAIDDTVGNSFAGIADATTWNFTTVDLLTTVLAMFGGGEKGYVYDPTDFANMFQDSARTTPVTALNDPVGSITDLSPNALHAGQATAGSRPTVKSDGSGQHLDLDGTDGLTTSAADFTGTDEMTIVIGNRVDSSGASIGILVEMSATVASNNGSIAIGERDGAAGDYGFNLRGTSVTTYRSPSWTPGAHVVSAQFNISGAARVDEVFPQVDGAVPGTLTTAGSANAGTGNFGNYAFNLGARNNAASNRVNGGLYRQFCIGRTLSVADYLIVKRWVSAPMGIII